MAHHGSGPQDGESLLERLGKQKEESLKELFDRLGPTSQYPDGKICDEDQGEIICACGSGVIDGQPKVVINFGTQVAWIGMTPEQARELAAGLTAHAKDAELIAWAENEDD